MEIRIRETGQVVHESEFRSMFPDTSMPYPLTPEIISDLGGDPVMDGQQVQPTRYQVAFRDGVEQIDGLWYTKYSVADMAQEAITANDAQQANNVRADRDRRLAETDWRFRSDMTPSPEWIAYCQALRDVPAQAGFPWEVQWPDKP